MRSIADVRRICTLRPKLSSSLALLASLIFLVACFFQITYSCAPAIISRIRVDKPGDSIPKMPNGQIRILLDSSMSVWCQFVSHTLNYLQPEMFVGRSAIEKGDKVVLLVDDRETLAHYWTIPWTMNMLGPEWRLQIITREKTFSFYEDIVETYQIGNAYVDTFENRYGYGSWVPDHFMHKVQFMVSAQFWQGVRGEFIIVIQDNGLPLRRSSTSDVASLLQELFKYGYAGAPWSLQEGVLPGGNGGFSFRRRSVLEKHAIDLQVTYSNLLARNTDLTPLGKKHEDGTLGNILNLTPFGIAPKRLAQLFSSEIFYHPKTFGVHHFAPRHSINETAEVVKMAVQEFFNVSDPSAVLQFESEGSGNIAGQFWLNSWRQLLKQYPNGDLPQECQHLFGSTKYD
jgi:hypothetical protein